MVVNLSKKMLLTVSVSLAVLASVTLLVKYGEEGRRDVIVVEIPRNAYIPDTAQSLIVVADGVPRVDGWFVVSLRERPAVKIIHNNQSFFAAIRITKVIRFENGTSWGEIVFETPVPAGQPVVFEFDKPGDYVVFTIPWPWLEGVRVRVVP
ncbi:MAG: hypothetical protein QXF95_01435 [Candidatus Caldarchaeum sp.]|uniref:Uncharacterized protein n=1 Tax=Caldiarchaeum subterraneum TaxID=311458 RepID=A0A7C5Q365_CALS0